MVNQADELLACDLFRGVSVRLVDVSPDVLVSERIPGTGKRLGDDALEEHITHKLIIVQAKLVPKFLECLKVLWDVCGFHRPKLEDGLQLIRIDKAIRRLVDGLQVVPHLLSRLASLHVDPFVVRFVDVYKCLHVSVVLAQDLGTSWI